MNKRNIVQSQKISNSVLRQDNWVLRKNLQHLVHATKRNADIQHKMDEIGEIVLRCADLESLIVKTTEKLKEQFGLTSVTYCLTDEFREMLGQDLSTIPPASAPTAGRLFFIEDELLSELFMQQASPTLRGKLEHGSVHCFPMKQVRRIRSEALLPLFYADRFFGSINFGSNDAVRYQEGVATDSLKRLSQILSMGFANLQLKWQSTMVTEKEQATG